jgi:hypothetical protein
MAAPMKITFSEAQSGGAVAIDLVCMTKKPDGNLCRREARIALSEALAMFGAETRIDAPRWKCSACGGFEIDVRPWFGSRTAGGLPSG